MMNINSLRERLKKRSAYRLTVAELRRMSLDVALDLDIDRADARRIAAEAVYGR